MGKVRANPLTRVGLVKDVEMAMTLRPGWAGTVLRLDGRT